MFLWYANWFGTFLLCASLLSPAKRCAGKASEITKQYREKFRLLLAAFRRNHELCKRLLLGHVKPEQLVRMNKEELDDAHSLKLRQEVLEKSRKRVVLDDEAAAKFSTAANKAMANKELQVWSLNLKKKEKPSCCSLNCRTYLQSKSCRLGSSMQTRGNDFYWFKSRKKVVVVFCVLLHIAAWAFSFLPL
jgi:hypothetical protein